MEAAYPGVRKLILQKFKKQGLQDAFAEVMVSSITDSTLKQYNTCLRRWWLYCQRLNLDVFAFDIQTVLNFRPEEFKKGCAYGSLNSMRSPSSLLLSPSIGTDPAIKRFFIGAQLFRPKTPKYAYTWDPSFALNY